MRGTLINSAAIAAGSLVGLAVRHNMPSEYQAVVIGGLGLVTVGIGIKMFLASKNILIVAAAIAAGGLIGAMLGISPGLDAFADWARQAFGASSSDFNKGLISTSILFCVGPMTVLGCLEDGLEGKIELLGLKSVLDGFGSIFFAAAMGEGVLVSALVVLVFQGALTLAARPMRGLADDPDLIAEMSGAGGAMLLGTGLGLLSIKDVRVEVYLPALAIAPLLVILSRRIPSLARVGRK